MQIKFYILTHFLSSRNYSGSSAAADPAALSPSRFPLSLLPALFEVSAAAAPPLRSALNKFSLCLAEVQSGILEL